MAVNEKQDYVERVIQTDHVDINEFIKAVKDAAKGLHNPKVDADAEETRYSNTVRFYVCGMRDLTAEEIKDKKEEEKARRALIEERERAQLEILTKRYGRPMSTAIEEPQVGQATGIAEDTIDDIPDMVCHIYFKIEGVQQPFAYCGIAKEADPHVHLHRSMGICKTRLHSSMTTCPRCGAPICEACRAIRKERRGAP